MEQETLTGKVALVTGGSRGIGAAISRKLAALGAGVAINFRSGNEAAREVADEIRRSGGIAEIFAADVTDPAAVKSMVALVAKTFGRIDIVVNNPAADLTPALSANRPPELPSHSNLPNLLPPDTTNTG